MFGKTQQSKVLFQSDQESGIRNSSQDLFISRDVDEVLSRGALHQLKWCQLKGDLITGGKVSMLYLCKVPFGCQLGTWTVHFVQTSLSMNGPTPLACPPFTSGRTLRKENLMVGVCKMYSLAPHESCVVKSMYWEECT